MNISVLIICRDLKDVSAVLKQLDEFTSDTIKLEILVAEGDNPSEQRNRLAEMAKSEWILFLDDDSIPGLNFFETYSRLIKLHPDVDICGGPSILLADKNTLSRLSHCFFNSSFGIGPFKSRYMSVGKRRRATEKELILCNLLVQKDFFLASGGFHKELHPNEENEFIKKSADAIIYYEPEAVVYRKSRATFIKFLKQMFKYGEGRAKHIHFRNSRTDVLFLIPTMFLFYIIFALFYFKVYGLLAFAPLLIHILLTIIFSITVKGTALYEKMFLMPAFNVMAHCSYGLGLFIGGMKYFIIKKFFYNERTLKYFRVHSIEKQQ
jgi:succinoglycan biosynthesis protein ExoA